MTASAATTSSSPARTRASSSPGSTASRSITTRSGGRTSKGRGIRCIEKIHNVDIANNLVRGALLLTGGETSRNNVVGPMDGWFVDPAAGNLRLSREVAEVVDQGLALPEVVDDIDAPPSRRASRSRSGRIRRQVTLEFGGLGEVAGLQGSIRIDIVHNGEPTCLIRSKRRHSTRQRRNWRVNSALMHLRPFGNRKHDWIPK